MTTSQRTYRMFALKDGAAESRPVGYQQADSEADAIRLFDLVYNCADMTRVLGYETITDAVEVTGKIGDDF